MFRTPWQSFFCQMFAALFVNDSGEAQAYSTPTEITAEQQRSVYTKSMRGRGPVRTTQAISKDRLALQNTEDGKSR